MKPCSYLVVPDFDVDVNSGFNFEVGNVSNRLIRAPDINNSSVDSHFEFIKGIGTITTRRSSGGNF